MVVIDGFCFPINFVVPVLTARESLSFLGILIRSYNSVNSVLDYNHTMIIIILSHVIQHLSPTTRTNTSNQAHNLYVWYWRCLWVSEFPWSGAHAQPSHKIRKQSPSQKLRHLSQRLRRGSWPVVKFWGCWTLWNHGVWGHWLEWSVSSNI